MPSNWLWSDILISTATDDIQVKIKLPNKLMGRAATTEATIRGTTSVNDNTSNRDSDDEINALKKEIEEDEKKAHEAR